MVTAGPQTALALSTEAALAWAQRFIAHVKRSKSEFTELDRQAGDGDFGTNVETAVTKAEQLLEQRPPETAAEVLQRLSAGFLSTGGTSGPLLGTWFRVLAKNVTDGATVATLADGVEAATESVQRLGRAAVGDRTMIDAMVPAALALRKSAWICLDLDAALRHAAQAARHGAESTAAMLGRKGRASYVGDAAVGAPDPGAVLIAALFDTATGPAEERRS
ncbi:dihydroxyacetone kinase subunit DhaL [Pseudonocardia spinosispora]|uniref:dihydroxyacetone kinase subunit DhaL n=1 Tax=Pseudonocardia spinosispora TaxID=103441 RepID=UPI000419B60B|nr:dihydroxyacetone kinase subunit DhaL [Pseudonocardia spinosispora]